MHRGLVAAVVRTRASTPPRRAEVAGSSAFAVRTQKEPSQVVERMGKVAVLPVCSDCTYSGTWQPAAAVLIAE